ncbi:TonB-dependent receptor [Emcibacter nanhaiensis]|nr:TonB-dependent receptor [Emcibacter nanhaiensis]
MLCASLSYAQEELESEDALTIDEIVVTAQKRAQSAQSTPISMGVVTGDEIATRVQNSLDDVLSNVPGVEVQGLAQGAQVYIRGVGSSVDPGFADPAVALMTDGVYNGRTESVNATAYDIDRVEVLRGPQGTIYGRNASGGSVNVITRSPILGSTSGYVKGQVGNYDAWRGEAALNLPVGEKTAVRFAGFREKRDGYVDDGSYDEDSWGVRGKLYAEPTDWLTILAKVDVFRQKGYGANTVPVEGSAGNLTFPPPYFFANFLDVVAGLAPPEFRFPDGWQKADPNSDLSNNPEHVPGYIKRESETYSIQFDAKVGPGVLTVLPSYTRNRNLLVSSFLFGSILPVAGPTYTINDNYGEQDAVSKYTSIEVRYASDSEGPLDYLLGFYYLNSDSGAPLDPVVATTTGGQTLSTTNTYQPGSTLAGFAQLTYSVTDEFRVTGGLRLSRDKTKQDYSYELEGVAGADATYRNTSDSTQYKIGLEYDVAEDAMVYAHVATGFKQGGISVTFPPTSFEPEHLTSYEAGIKSRFMDGRVQLNAAAFRYDYDNYQFSSFQTLQIGDFDATSDFPVVQNADSTHINGAEVQLDAVPWEGGLIKVAVTYLDAEYGTAIIPNSPFFNQGDFDLAGRQIQNSPEWAADIGFEQSFSLASGTVTVGVNSHLTKGYYTTPEQYAAGAWQPGFTKTDAHVSYHDDTAGWNVSVAVRNIEDEIQTTYVFPAYRRFISAPRTFTVSAGYEF